jgi:hypothetical protein
MGDEHHHENENTRIGGQKWVMNIVMKANILLLGGKNG